MRHLLAICTTISATGCCRALAQAEPGGTQAEAAVVQRFPTLPKLVFGVNQYNVGPPELEGKHWPLKDDEIERLKALGVNTIRFPLYPAEVGLPAAMFDLFEPGQRWDDAAARETPFDWRSLDAILDQLARHGITPYISPAAENGTDWQTKAWMRLHIPEEVGKTVWFTRSVAEHVQQRYGGNVIYGWFEDWFWNTHRHDRSTRFAGAWQEALGRMYGGDLAALNANWRTSCASFAEAMVPALWAEGGGVPREAIASRRTYDFRRSVDWMQRESLEEMRRELKRVSPGAVWAGGCICGELGGWLDIRSVDYVKTNASIRTHALTSDFLTADTYAPAGQYAFYYRTLAKIAHSVGKGYLVAEVSAVQPAAFEAIAEAGGAIAGVLAWAGKEDTFGFFKMDGTYRQENAEAFGRLYQRLTDPAGRSDRYVPGRVHVYVPEETLEFSITQTNFMDAYFHICDALPAKDLEPVLTDDLADLRPDVPVFVLEQVLPRRAITELNRLGARLICPHPFFIDENGERVDRAHGPGDFYTELMRAEGGASLVESFARVWEKANNLADVTRGGAAQVQAKLAERNVVISGRPNDPANLVDGSIFMGVTFADERQEEVVELVLPREETVSCAFVELFEGSEAEQIAASRVPAGVRLSVCGDDGGVHEVPATMAVAGPRLRLSFAPTVARRVHLDFGTNDAASGMRIVEVGVLGRSLQECALP
jgi:hypothetical protein